MSDALRSKLIRLAHQKPELRPDLLPILKSGGFEDETDRLQRGEAEAKEILNREMEPLKRGFWMPPHNIALNFALMGANLWTFTILPLFWKKKSYRADLNGIVIHPAWRSVNHDRLGPMSMSGFEYLTPAVAESLVAGFKRVETIPDTVKKEIRLIEQAFGIDVPSNISSQLVADSIKVAKRRWGVNTLKVKDRLIPLDGSKPRDLGAFD
jgi:hypothetical protein